MNNRSVLVIGGGIAGLAAARELARNNVFTTVIEAKNRFGGRIHTIHDDEAPVELGAEFVHGQNKSLMEAIRRARLKTLPVPDKHRLFANGRFKDINIWDIIGGIFNRIDIHKPDCSMEEFLNAEAIAEPEASLVRNFINGFDAAHTGRISAHARRRAEYSAEHMGMDIQLRVANGYSALVEEFVKEIENYGGRLLRSTAALNIRWEKGSVEVVAERNNRHEMFLTDAAVITLPLGVLKTNEVKFEPSLAEKMEAANALEMGNVVRIVFLFKDAVWEDFGFIHAPSEAVPTWWSDSRGALLVGWAGGPRADALLDSSSAELERTGLDILGKLIFEGESAFTIRKRLVASFYHNWAADPHIRGAYSYIPVNGLDLPKLLAAPVADTLFFAGEATVTDGVTGTVFGALETGLRAAQEILNSQEFCMMRAA